MVATRSNGKLEHARFNELPRFLRAGDLVVDQHVRTDSRSRRCDTARRHGARAAALDADAGRPLARRAAARRRALHGRRRRASGSRCRAARTPSSSSATPTAAGSGSPQLHLPKPLDRYLAEHGRPIRYGYVSGQWPLDAYQNVYAVEPGSVEPPSAGPPVHARAAHAARREGRARRADRPAHRRLLAGARRAALSRVVPRARGDRRARQRRPRLGRPRDRGRNDGRARARNGYLAGRHRRVRRGLDVARDHARARACTRSTA